MTYPAARNPFSEPRRLLALQISKHFVKALLPTLAQALEFSSRQGLPLDPAAFSEEQLRLLRHLPPAHITLNPSRQGTCEFTLPLHESVKVLSGAQPVWAWDDAQSGACTMLLEVTDDEAPVVHPGQLVPSAPTAIWRRHHYAFDGHTLTLPPELMAAVMEHGTVVTIQRRPPRPPSEDSTHDEP